MKPVLFSLLGGLLGFLPSASAGMEFAGPMQTGTMPASVAESSGLAVSRRDANLLWTHNDSGGEPVLRAIDADGRLRGTLRIRGIENRDWEDLASFELDGRAWLLIAETGDNAGNRHDCTLYVVPEPDPADLAGDFEIAAKVAWQIPVRYPDGPRDCEAVAVDAAGGQVYLLSKRDRPHRLYSVPLRASNDRSEPETRIIGVAPNRLFPQPDAAQALLPLPTGRYRAQPTGMDFAADGSAAVIVSYGDVLIFPRQKDEDWGLALLRAPAVLAPHGLNQAEGVAFSADGRTIFVSSEGDGAPVLRYDAK